MDLGFRFDSIWVIEFLHEEEDKTGASLHKDVIAPGVANWQTVTSHFRPVGSKVEFLSVLKEIERDARVSHRWPILHVESHGNSKGLGRDEHEFVSWDELRDPLTRINRATRLNLTVTLAACSGAEMHRVLSHLDQAPFLYVSGPTGAREAWELRLGFGRFYKEVLSSLDMRAAFNLLNGTARPAAWTYPVIPAERFFQRVFEEYVAVDCSPAELRARENEIVARIARSHEPDLIRLAVVRAEVRATLSDQRPFFDGFRRRFFMIDEFPENDERFPVSWADVQGART